MKTIILLVLSLLTLITSAQKTEKLFLSGTDKDHTKTWDFFCTGGRNSNAWSTIAVPSCWEMQGYGTLSYGNKQEFLPNEKGLYRYPFSVPSDWKDKKIFIVFDGSMTDTEVKINGTLAGPIHQGAFYQFKYDISKLLKYGKENLLEVTVSKLSTNKSINGAEREVDFWVFGGIFRPVYLEAFPKQHIERVAINALADGSFNADLYLGGVSKNLSVETTIKDTFGKVVLNNITPLENLLSGKASVSGKVNNPKTWNPEWPTLYTVTFNLKKDGKSVHQTTEKFGFRTVEVRQNDGIYVNGQKVIFRGVNRHSSWPTSGRTMSKELSILDVNLMKEMNMNAVRMSHYPPDVHFLDVCDSLGLFVLDELTGWQKSYDTQAGRPLVKETVIRDVNHPSIILWDNGNEGGWNFDLDDDFAKYDPQNRPVIHPWDNYKGLGTSHYKPYDYGLNIAFQGRDIFFPTEMLHGLYDGGAGASLDDFWKLMLTKPLSAGGFIWVFADEGIVRTDKGGIVDIAGESAPDGIVGPFREKEASFYTIKEIWSPVYIDLPYISLSFDGKIEVRNQFQYTNLNQCKIKWKLFDYAKPSDASRNEKTAFAGNIISPDIAPATIGSIQLPLPSDWRNHDALSIEAFYPDGREMNKWTWPVKSPAQMASGIVDTTSVGSVSVTENDNEISMEASGVKVKFDKKTGYLISAENKGGSISFNNGPQMAFGKFECAGIKHYAQGTKHVVEINAKGNPREMIWTMHSSGWLQLDYGYSFYGEMDYAGINFSYPEEKITGMKWLGRGPYRVWKNRLKGVPFGLYHKDYNNTVTGESWNYPEFKGYHSDFYWVTIENKEMPFSVVSGSYDIFLRMFSPQKPKVLSRNNVFPAFPEGDISFLHGIAPIGTKTQPSLELGPQGNKNMLYSMKGDILRMKLFFDFRAK